MVMEVAIVLQARGTFGRRGKSKFRLKPHRFVIGKFFNIVDFPKN